MVKNSSLYPSVPLNVTVNSTTSHIELTGLFHYTWYYIEVAGFTRKEGVRSVPINVSTDENGSIYLTHNSFCLMNCNPDSTVYFLDLIPDFSLFIFLIGHQIPYSGFWVSVIDSRSKFFEINYGPEVFLLIQKPSTQLPGVTTLEPLS